MKKKENQRIALTKLLLKENLLQLMSEKDFQSITVTELCDAAGVNRSTFYNHYGCPADVLADVEKGVFADLENIWENNTEGKNSPINMQVEALCTYLESHRELAKHLFRNSNINSGFGSKLIDASHICPQNLSHIQNQGNAKLAITFITNGIYYTIRQWILDDIPKTPKEISELTCLLAKHVWDRSIS